jgi:hypothetical protein
MTWLSALLIGLSADIIVAFCLYHLVKADKVYQADKLARWKAEGIYYPIPYPPIIETQETYVTTSGSLNANI